MLKVVVLQLLHQHRANALLPPLLLLLLLVLLLLLLLLPMKTLSLTILLCTMHACMT
jgi:hypothetical protein